MNDGPLNGIQVLDFSRVVAGPLCGRLLADQGADVIKVEPPQRDMTRTAPPLIEAFSSYFTQFNAGKRGICADLADPEIVELLATLAESADVVLENFRPGVLARYSLGAEQLRARNPRLVYCSISGYGQTGPWADRRAFAPVVHGEAGVLASNARLHDAPVRQEAFSQADIQSGLLAMGAIAAALFDRERTGRGQHLDISLADTAVYTNEFSGPELSGQSGPATYAGAASVVLTLGDGTVVVTQGNPADNFRQWVRAMRRPELLEDPRFSRYPERLKHLEEIGSLLREFAAGFASFEAFHATVDPQRLAVGAVRSVAELSRTPWAEERGLVCEPVEGLRFARAPYRSTRGDIGARERAPIRGEHNRSVLKELLDLGDEQLDELQNRNALCSAEDGRS